MKSHPLAAAVDRFLQRETITAGPMLVAVSGGPDSIALLHALHQQALPGDVIAAHLNHQLRGTESDADAAFVAEFCAARPIPVRIERLPVREEAESAGENLESTARRLRCQWLAEVARSLGASWVATGHTADDQAETVLHNLLRGTGPRGLRGIAQRRSLAPGIEVLRPLLLVTRAQVLDFLQAHRLPSRQDSSNLDLNLTRNRIRHELLPMLKERFNPEIVTVLGRLADQAADWQRLQEEQARALLSKAERPRAGAMLVLDAKVLERESRHLVREALHLLWERENWPRSAMGFEAWERLAALVFDGENAVDLPDGIEARRKDRVLQLRRLGPDAPNPA